MNGMMVRLVLCAGLMFAWGCQTPSRRESEYDRVSRQMERIAAESEMAAAGLGNIRVEIRMLSVSEEDYFAIEGLFRYADENVVIAAQPSAYYRSGLRIAAAGENFRTQVRIVKEQSKSSEETEMFLVMADGASGYLFVGREILVPQFYYANRWFTSVGYDFVRAGRAFEAAARTLGSGLIEMQLTPVFSEFLNDGGDLRMTELTTTVQVRPGQTIVIGRSDTRTEDLSAAMLSTRRQGRRMQMIITVTPMLQ